MTDQPVTRADLQVLNADLKTAMRERVYSKSFSGSEEEAEMTYPNKVVLTDERGTCHARVTTSINGHIVLKLSKRVAQRFGWLPPAAPAPFGEWSSIHGEPGMRSTFLTDYAGAVAALAPLAAPGATWRRVE